MASRIWDCEADKPTIGQRNNERALVSPRKAAILIAEHAATCLVYRP